MAEQNLTKYPKEIAAVVRKTKALAISAYYNIAKSTEGDTPLAVYDKTFSRLTVAALDTEAKGKGSASSNIPIRELAEIFARTEYAFNKHMDALYSGVAKEESLSPAYTVRISSGTLKGKTPAEVLIESGEEGKKALVNQYNWLKENVAKYPKNKTQMDAIVEACNLFKAGNLSAENTRGASNKPITIYNAEARALIRKAREDGMCPVHNIDIVWNLGENSPVTVTVTNFYAPVLKRDDGTISPQVKQMDKETLVRISMNCTSAEWMNVVRSIKTSMNQFEVATSRTCIEDANNAEKLLREAENK